MVKLSATEVMWPEKLAIWSFTEKKFATFQISDISNLQQCNILSVFIYPVKHNTALCNVFYINTNCQIKDSLYGIVL